AGELPCEAVELGVISAPQHLQSDQAQRRGGVRGQQLVDPTADRPVAAAPQRSDPDRAVDQEQRLSIRIGHAKVRSRRHVARSSSVTSRSYVPSERRNASRWRVLIASRRLASIIALRLGPPSACRASATSLSSSSIVVRIVRAPYQYASPVY